MQITITLTDNPDGTLDFSYTQDSMDDENSEALNLLNHFLDEIVCEADEIELHDLPIGSTNTLQ